jgi:hypothetical protein
MRLLTILLAGVFVASAFVPNHLAPVALTTASRKTRLNFVEVSDMDTARTAFFIWFFGASGGAGIARGAFPRMYKNVQTIQGLKDEGPTLGGETVPLSFVCGYPTQGLSIADIKQVVNADVEKIVVKYPVEGNFLSAKGYLTFKAFQAANKKSNPLTVRAVFDTLNSSTDVCNPETAQEKLDAYKADPALVASELLKAKLIGFTSIFVLLFLLGLADVIAFGHAREGWFPDWPGLTNLPASLFDAEIGLRAIPSYWVSDSPSP